MIPATAPPANRAKRAHTQKLLIVVRGTFAVPGLAGPRRSEEWKACVKGPRSGRQHRHVKTRVVSISYAAMRIFGPIACTVS